MHITVFISDIFNTHWLNIFVLVSFFLVCVISFSRGSSLPRDQAHVSCVPCVGRQVVLTTGTTQVLCPCNPDNPSFTSWPHLSAWVFWLFLSYCLAVCCCHLLPYICLNGNGLPHMLARQTLYFLSYIFILILGIFFQLSLVSKRRKEFWFCLKAFF